MPITRATNLAGLGTVFDGTELRIGSSTDTGTANQLLQVTGGAYVSGNTGIGTTNPSANFYVYGRGVFDQVQNAQAPALVAVGKSFNTAPFTVTNLEKFYGGVNYDLNGIDIRSSGGVDALALVTRIGLTSGQGSQVFLESHARATDGTKADFVVATRNIGAPTEKFRVTSNGLVGIGTTNPAFTFSVNGSIHTYSGVYVQNPAAFAGGTNFSSPHMNIINRQGGTEATGDVARLNFGNGAGAQCYIDGLCSDGTNSYSSLLFRTREGDGVAERCRITSNGYLLIGYTVSNGGYRLQVNSQIFATSSTIATSDGRYKENIETLNGGFDIIKLLRPVSFTWKPQQDITHPTEVEEYEVINLDENGNRIGKEVKTKPKLVREGHKFPKGVHVGFIAQEVEGSLSKYPWVKSLVKENISEEIIDKDGNVLAPKETFLGIAEGNMIAILTSALKEAVEKIEKLESEVSKLSNKIDML